MFGMTEPSNSTVRLKSYGGGELTAATRYERVVSLAYNQGKDVDIYRQGKTNLSTWRMD